MKLFQVLGLSTFIILTGCYKFAEPPFSESDMVPIKESKLTQEIIAARSSLPDSDQAKEVGESLGKIEKVYEISPSLVIAQETKKSGTNLLAMMKNEHHFMICTLMADDAKESASGVTFTKGKGPFDGKTVSGDPAALRAWAEDYVVNGAKMCIAVPYADAREVKSESGSWFSDLFG